MTDPNSANSDSQARLGLKRRRVGAVIFFSGLVFLAISRTVWPWDSVLFVVCYLLLTIAAIVVAAVWRVRKNQTRKRGH